jgi:hypothetical protein
VNDLEIQIYTPTQAQPLPPIEWNYLAVKQWVEDGLAAYKGRIYTDDTISQAKTDRATLNKLAAAIDAKRKEMKAVYLAPYTEFEAQTKELAAMVKAASDEINAQVKAYDDHRKAEKLAEIKAIYQATFAPDIAELVPYERIHNERWLNATYNIENVRSELEKMSEGISTSLATIDALGLENELTIDIKRIYLKTFDLAAALQEKERIVKEREKLKLKAKSEPPAPVEVKTAPQPQEFRKEEAPAPEVHTIDFRVWATGEQLNALKTFLRANNIKYGPVPVK